MKMFDKSGSSKYNHAKRLMNDAEKQRMILTVSDSAKDRFKRKPYENVNKSVGV